MTARAALFLSLLVTTGCQYVQDGWAFRPFEGPGYDMDDGLLIDAEEDATFVIAATYLPVAREGRSLFRERMEAISAELEDGPDGLIGYSLGNRLLGGEYRTVTVWEDEEAMMAFVLGEAHLAAMGDSTEIADPEGAALVHRWEITADQLPPLWDDVIEMTDGSGRQVAY